MASKKVSIKLVIDDKGAIQSVEGLEGGLSGVSGGLGSIGRTGPASFLKLAGGIGTAMGVVFALNKALNLTADFLKASVFETAAMEDQIAKLSRRVGVSVSDLSSYRLAVELSGTSLESLAVGLRVASRNLLDASRGTGEAKDSLDDLGISATDNNGKLKSVNSVLLEVADKFAGMEDGTRKTALAMEIFGRSGTDLIPMLNAGADGISEMQSRADALGITFDEVTAAQAEKFNDELLVMQKALEGAKMAIGNELIPVFTDLITEFTESPGRIQAFREGVKDVTEIVLTSGEALAIGGSALAQFGAVALDVGGRVQEFQGRITFNELTTKTGQAMQKAGKSLESLPPILDSLAEKFARAQHRIQTDQSTDQTRQLEAAMRLLQDSGGGVVVGFERVEDVFKRTGGAADDAAANVTKLKNSTVGLVPITLPGFKRNDDIPSLRTPTERAMAELDRAETRLQQRSAFEITPEYKAGELPSFLPGPKGPTSFGIEMVPPQGELEAGISAMKTFDEEMGGVLGNLTDKFGLYSQAIDAVGDAWGQFITGQDAFGSAMRKAVAGSLASISKESIVKAIYHTAMGVAALTPWGALAYGPAPIHFKAAALFGAVAGASGAAARGLSGGGGESQPGMGNQGGPFNPVYTRSGPFEETYSLGTSNSLALMQGEGGLAPSFNPILTPTPTQPDESTSALLAAVNRLVDLQAETKKAAETAQAPPNPQLAEVVEEIRGLSSEFSRLGAASPDSVVVLGVEKAGGLYPLMSTDDKSDLGRDIQDSRLV